MMAGNAKNAQLRPIKPGRKRNPHIALSSSPLAQPVVKRTKIEQACANCRTLRRKCDGESPCKTCSENNTQCFYAGGSQVPTEKLTLARAVKRIAHLEERLRVYEGLPTSDTQHTRQAEYPLGLPAPDHTENEYDMAKLLQGVNSLNITTRNPEHYGPASCDAVESEIERIELSTQRDMPTEPKCYESRAEVWRLCINSNLRFAKASRTLSQRTIPDRYVRKYFETAHHLYPVVNELSFMDRYTDLWNGRPTEGRGYEMWEAVLYMVIAIGHQYSTVDRDPLVRSAASASQDGDMYFELAKTTFANVPFTGGDISAVNSMFLAFVWLYNKQRLHEAYSLLGSAIRVAYAIGLHREIVNPNASPLEVQGWNASWWCLFIYEMELSVLLGRPSAMQPDEVDVRQFPLDSSSIELQYIERMRQLSRLAFDSYRRVYSLTFKHTNSTEREFALAGCDRVICGWHDSWYPHSPWAKEPHGVVFSLRFLNIRVLLHRVFLRLLVRKGRKGEDVKEDVLRPAAKCIDLSISLIKLAKPVQACLGGTLQAALFQATGYLWNATLTLFLYITDQGARTRLVADQHDILTHIYQAVHFFRIHQEIIPFARVAAQRAERLLRRVAPSIQQDMARNTFDINIPLNLSAEAVSPNASLDFLADIDMSAFEAHSDSFFDLFNSGAGVGILADAEMGVDNSLLPWSVETDFGLPYDSAGTE